MVLGCTRHGIIMWMVFCIGLDLQTNNICPVPFFWSISLITIYLFLEINQEIYSHKKHWWLGEPKNPCCKSIANTCVIIRTCTIYAVIVDKILRWWWCHRQERWLAALLLTAVKFTDVKLAKNRSRSKYEPTVQKSVHAQIDFRSRLPMGRRL